MSLQDDIAEARRNIAAAQQAEQARIDKLVKEASKQTEVWAAEQALAQRQREQEQEAAIQAREQARLQQERDDAQQRYLSAGGLPDGFEVAVFRQNTTISFPHWEGKNRYLCVHKTLMI
jgi:hypothetical protein